MKKGIRNQRLIDARERTGMSLTVVAEKLKTTRVKINRFELGQVKLNIQWAKILAALYNVHPSEIMDEYPAEPPNPHSTTAAVAVEAVGRGRNLTNDQTQAAIKWLAKRIDGKTPEDAAWIVHEAEEFIAGILTASGVPEKIAASIQLTIENKPRVQAMIEHEKKGG